MNFQRKSDRQLKLSNLSASKRLKLSKMSKPLGSLLPVDIGVKVAGDPFQNLLRELMRGAELGSLS